MVNPNVIYRGSGMNYQRALDNFSALAEGRFEETEFSRDSRESGSVRKNIPWLQGTLDIDEKDDMDEADLLHPYHPSHQYRIFPEARGCSFERFLIHFYLD